MAVGALALIVVGGGQADFAARNAKEVALQSAVDAATLEGAADLTAPNGKRRRAARAVFDVNLSPKDLNRVENFQFTATPTSDSMRVTATGNFKPLFLPLIGLSELRIDVAATAADRLSTSRIEHVLLLDTTESIIGQNPAERAAVSAAVLDAYNILLDAKSNGLDLIASLMPFSDRVNLSEFDRQARTGDTDPLNIATGTFPAEGNGCFEPRTSPLPGFPFALDDAPPSATGGRFTFTDTFGTTGLAVLGDIDINNNGTFEPFESPWTGNNAALPARSPICPEPVIFDVISLGQVQTTLSNLDGRGTGRFDVGLAWAWRALSPRWQGELGVSVNYPSDDPEVRKVITMITDGRSTAWFWEAGRANGAGGGAGHGRNEVTDIGFAHIVELCDRIKRSGVEIEIVLAFTYPRAIEPFEQCASPGRFTRVTGVGSYIEEVDNFANIASEIRLIE